MINTVDFITPPVDDPYWFGQISAANSISDVYSMGGKPLTALNIVMFPSKKLDMGLLREILRGGHDKTVEAGACLVGGHTVDDLEPKYGLSVSGVVHPDRIITNAGSRVGDALILTKPVGSGVLFNAARSGKLEYKHLESEILPTLADLNGPAMEEALKFNLHGCTDITGFGILGHLLEIAHGCDKRVVIHYRNLPVYPYVLDMYNKGETTGSNRANRKMVANHNLYMNCDLNEKEEEILYDPQTSGGLVLSLPKEEVDELLENLHNRGVGYAAKIGEIIDEPVGIAVE